LRQSEDQRQEALKIEVTKEPLERGISDSEIIEGVTEEIKEQGMPDLFADKLTSYIQE